MIKSKFTLLVLFLAIILFSPKNSRSQSPIEELQQMNDSLQQLQNEAPHAHVCPCYSLKKLNQLVEDYGPFIPDPGSTEVQDRCTGTAFQAADELRTIRISERGNLLRVRQQDLCERESNQEDITNRVIEITVEKFIYSNGTEENNCQYYIADRTDGSQDSSYINLITNEEHQACRNIAIQWAHQGND